MRCHECETQMTKKYRRPRSFKWVCPACGWYFPEWGLFLDPVPFKRRGLPPRPPLPAPPRPLSTRDGQLPPGPPNHLVRSPGTPGALLVVLGPLLGAVVGFLLGYLL